MHKMERPSIWPAVVIGAGPAGLAAGLQLSRAGCKTLLLESGRPGGRARSLGPLENYPGFPGVTDSRKLMDRFESQARGWGLTLKRAQALSVRPGPGRWQVKLASGGVVSARALIYCGGAQFRELPLPRRPRQGLYHAAYETDRCLRGLSVAVVGSGETAVHQAVALSPRAGRVYLISRGPLKAHDLLLRRLAACANVERLPGCRVVEALGGRSLKALRLRGPQGRSRTVKADALFALIGMQPRALPGLRRGGPGLFVAGDAAGEIYRQVAVASGQGVAQAMRCLAYLRRA